MKNQPPRPRGRPRTFDREEVLDHAITTFWANGYRGASLDDLTESMGISRPSLYATFGSKHGLFLEAIDRYAETLGSRPMKALFGDRDIRQAVATFFETSIHCATTEGRPRGCLIASVATEEAENDEQVREKVSGMFAETDRVIADRFLVARDDGQIPPGSDPRALARMVISVTHSFAARARVGTSRKMLSRLAKDFMAVLFPTPK